MRAGPIVQRGLRTPTGPFFATFFIGIILGLVAEFAFHGTVEKAGYVFFRCTLEESQADRWLEVPAWMFDRTAYPDPGLLAAQPYVSIEALAALSALLDLALKDQTPSAVLLSNARGCFRRCVQNSPTIKYGLHRNRRWAWPALCD